MFNDKHAYSDDELIRRVWDVIEIKNIMALHAYYHSFNLHIKELEEIWVQKPENRVTASFGQNWGYNVGFKRIMEYYGTGNVENDKKELEMMRTAFPEIENKEENYGIGKSLVHALTTPYIEVAADGQTAQGLWYAPGYVGGPTTTGANVAYMYEKYGVDFIREDGEWKIWHLFVGTDFMAKPGEDFNIQDCPAEVERKIALGIKPEGVPEGGFPEFEPAEGFIPIKDAYTMYYNYSEYPPIPLPYGSFSETVSNGIEGNPNYQKEGRK